MAQDGLLDYLKKAQDLAFQRKQDAYRAQEAAWQRRSSARDALNRAHEEKQRAYAAQDASRQNYQRVRSYNSPRIDQLNSQQENAFQNMKNAFERASSAHDMRDVRLPAITPMRATDIRRKPRAASPNVGG